MGIGVNTTIVGGQLGRIAASEDGVSAMVLSGAAVAGKFALGDVLGPYTTIQQIEALEINAAYDVANNTNAYQNCKEFFEFAEEYGGVIGSGLYIMVVANTVTMEDICDKSNSYAKKLLAVGTQAGKIKLLGITRVPDGAYTPSYTDQLDDDIAAAVVKLKALYTEELGYHRPFQTLLEARDWQGTISSTLDLRDATNGLNWDNGGLVIGKTKGMYDLGVTVTEVAESASVGAALGSMAALAVQRSIGRVKNGPIPTQTAVYLSDGTDISTLSDADIESLGVNSVFAGKGFIFPRKHNGKAGHYWNHDCNATPQTSDFAYASKSRPIHKMVRRAHAIYIEDYQDDVLLDAETGKLSPSVVKSFQERITEDINDNMVSNGELSAFSAFCNPDQDVQIDDQVDVDLRAVSKGRVNRTNVTVGYTTSLS